MPTTLPGDVAGSKSAGKSTRMKKPKAAPAQARQTKAPDAVPELSQFDARFYRDQFFEKHREERRQWLRAQLVGWWATVTGEIEAVQAELQKRGSDLTGAFTNDELRELEAALERCWDALTPTNVKPQCVPAFLKAEPFTLPKTTRTEANT